MSEAPSRRTLARVALACAFVVLLLGLAHSVEAVAAWEAGLTRHVRGVAGPAGDAFARIFHALGYWSGVVPAGALLVAVLAVRKRIRDALFVLVALGGGLLLNGGLKLLVGRARPDIHPAVHEITLSFPSGHASASAALACVLVLLAWPTRARTPALLAGIALALAVGTSRVVAGVHHPGDVVAGWAFGIGWACAVRSLLPPKLRAAVKAEAHRA